MTNLFEAEFGGATAIAEATGAQVREPTNRPVQTNTPPPKATDAPTKGNNNIFNGLCEALNLHQKRLEKQYPGYVADEYVIEFASAAIADAKVTKPNLNVYKNTAGKNVNTAADKLDSDTDTVNVNSQIWNITAGTQIAQLIDQIMRSSAYITSQQKGNYDANGKWIPNPKANPNQPVAWYKISVSGQALKYDRVRRDFAYRIKFTVSPYAINQMASQYFNDSRYRGTHKAYNYWFTGLNNQIISYEQDYNQAYYTTLSGNPNALAVPPAQGRDQFKQTYMATSEQRTQGQANYVNDPSDSASSFLYSIADFSEVRVKIVGDPSWMQQGEVARGINARAFEYRPFNADGGINYDSQQVTFQISFNRPTDYNLNTGIMNVNSGTGAPKETLTFIAKSCKNVFSKGQFTQELVGSLLPLNTQGKNDSNDRTSTGLISQGNPAGGGAPSVSSSSANPLRETNLPYDGSMGFELRDETGQLSQYRQNEYGDLYVPLDNQTQTGSVGGIPAPQPANPPEPPDSTGDIDVFAGLAGTDPGSTSQGPQIIAKDD
jgi:hypothetical protein